MWLAGRAVVPDEPTRALELEQLGQFVEPLLEQPFAGLVVDVRHARHQQEPALRSEHVAAAAHDVDVDRMRDVDGDFTHDMVQREQVVVLPMLRRQLSERRPLAEHEPGLVAAPALLRDLLQPALQSEPRRRHRLQFRLRLPLRVREPRERPRPDLLGRQAEHLHALADADLGGDRLAVVATDREAADARERGAGRGEHQRLQMVAARSGIDAVAGEEVAVGGEPGSRNTVDMMARQRVAREAPLDLVPRHCPSRIGTFADEPDARLPQPAHERREPTRSAHPALLLQEQVDLVPWRSAPTVLPGADVVASIGAVQDPQARQRCGDRGRLRPFLVDDDQYGERPPGGHRGEVVQQRIQLLPRAGVVERHDDEHRIHGSGHCRRFWISRSTLAITSSGRRLTFRMGAPTLTKWTAPIG